MPVFAYIVSRVVKYAFANIPANIGRVFFSKEVALPWMRWRMLRHGFLHSPVSYEEVEIEGRNVYEEDNKLAGLYLTIDRDETPDVIMLYLHGGGFAMGSAYFYLEFLMAWLTLLFDPQQAKTPSQSFYSTPISPRPGSEKENKGSKKPSSFQNPAILALEYTLVPEAIFPTQLNQVQRAYAHAVELVDHDAKKVVVAGDSAGATLVLSLLLSLARDGSQKPNFAALISPWCRLVSPLDEDTDSDYLNGESLHLYAKEYCGQIPSRKTKIGSRAVNEISLDDPIASPGSCKDLGLWRRAMPMQGMHIIYGAEEVFAKEARVLIKRIHQACNDDWTALETNRPHKSDETGILIDEEPAQIHAWPVVNLFLMEKRSERLKGLRRLAEVLIDRQGA